MSDTNERDGDDRTSSHDDGSSNRVVFDQQGQQVGEQTNIAGDLIVHIQAALRIAPGGPFLLGLAGIVLMVLASVVLWRSWPAIMDWWAGPLCGDTRLCAVVAEFVDLEPGQRDELSSEIAQQIHEILDQESPTQSVVAVVPSVESADAARRTAVAEGALLAVWGSVVEQAGKLLIHFELTDLMGVGESHGLRTLRAEPQSYVPITQDVDCTNCFDITEGEAAQRVAIVSYAAVGLLYYAEQPEKAYQYFSAALYCAGEDVDHELVDVIQPDCLPGDPHTDGKSALLYYYAGKSAVLGGDYKTGIDLLQIAAARNRRDPAAPLGIGAAYQAWTGDDGAPQAAAAFAQAEERGRDLLGMARDDARRGVLYHHLGLGYELQGDWPLARENYVKAVARFGADNQIAYDTLVRLAYVLQRDGDIAGAEQTLEQAADLDPQAPWAYLELASLAWHERQERKGAERWLNRAQDVAPNNAAVPLRRAELCVAWEEFECAETANNAALALRPNSGWVHSTIGTFYLPTTPFRLGQNWDQALEHYEWAVELRPQDPWAHERLAYALMGQDRQSEAVDHYQRAIELTFADTAPARLYCNLALAQDGAGLADEAEISRSECTRRSVTDQ